MASLLISHMNVCARVCVLVNLYQAVDGEYFFLFHALSVYLANIALVQLFTCIGCMDLRRFHINVAKNVAISFALHLT